MAGQRKTYLKNAKFDIIKTFENYTFEDIKMPSSINPEDVINVEFITRKENLVLYGNVGSGKTHLAIVGRDREYQPVTLVKK